MEITSAKYLDDKSALATIAGIKIAGDDPRTVTGVITCFWDGDDKAWAIDVLDINDDRECEAVYAATLDTLETLAPDCGPILPEYWQQIARLAGH